MQTFIAGLPKAELHLHIEGTLEPELLFTLAARNKIPLKYSRIEELRAAYAFTNLQSFLDIYYQGMETLRHEQDFYDLTWQYLLKAQNENVRHVEIFFDPQAHTRRGITLDVVINGIYAALNDGKKQLGISFKLIPCLLRDESIASGQLTFQQLLPYRNWITGLGLCSAEANHPPQKFSEIFAQARQQGWQVVAHAGEEGPATYIWEALHALQVTRIDHGVRCIEDIKLMDHLKHSQTPLTVCPLSNVKLKVYPQLERHPLKQILNHGICATVNSDDPAYFGGYINENYYQAHLHLNLTQTELYTLAKNSFQASFLTASEKANYLQELALYYQQASR